VIQGFCIGQCQRKKIRTANPLLALTTTAIVVLKGIVSEYYDN